MGLLLLPTDHRKYTRLIFLVYHRIEYKKKLGFVTYGDLDKFAQILLPSWTVLSQADNPTWDVAKGSSLQAPIYVLALTPLDGCFSLFNPIA